MNGHQSARHHVMLEGIIRVPLQHFFFSLPNSKLWPLLSTAFRKFVLLLTSKYVTAFRNIIQCSTHWKVNVNVWPTERVKLDNL